MNTPYPLLRSCLLLTAFLGLFNGSMLSQNAFYFEYLGPDTIFVNDNCFGILDWGYPDNPDFECLSNLCVTIDTTLTISDGYQIGDSIPVGTTVTMDLLVVDNQGNNLDTFFTIYFSDHSPPVFDSLSLPPPALSFACIDDLPPPPSSAGFLAYDNCSALGDSLSPILITFDSAYTIPDSCSGGTIQRIWTATDFYGNTTAFTQWIIIEPDTFPPVFTTLPLSDTTSCENADFTAWISQQRALVEALDNECGLLSVHDDAPGSIGFTCGSQQVIFTAIDRCGNIATTSATYTLIDSIPPQILPVPKDSIFLSCSVSLTKLDSLVENFPSIFTIDNCGDISWSNTFNGLSGGCSDETGTADVFFIADDGCGNQDSVRITFSLTDTVPPDFSSPPVDLEISCDTADLTNSIDNWLSALGNAEFSDNCSATDSLSVLIRLAGQVATAKAIRDSLLVQKTCNPSVDIHFELSDPCGNIRVDTASISLIDTLPPAWTLPPGDLSIPCSQITLSDSLINQWLEQNGFGALIESCGGLSVQNDFSGLQPGCGPTGSALVTFTAEDYCGNMAAASATVEIFDSIPPYTLLAAMDTTSECQGSQTALNQWIDNKAGAVITDDCDAADWQFFVYNTPASLTDTISFGDYGNYPLVPDSACDWSLQLRFVFADSCSNRAHTDAVFQVQDKTSPLLFGLVDSLFAGCDNVPAPGNPQLTDNCDPAPELAFEETLIPGNCAHTYSLRRKWVATDYCGNADSLIQWVIVADDSPPLLSGIPADRETACDSIPPPPLIGPEISAQDNCDTSLLIQFSENILQDPDPAACGHYTYVIERKWSVTDDCGNLTESVQNLFVKDTVPPAFQGPDDITISCEDVLDTDLTGLPDMLQDNCDPQPLTSFSDDIQAGACPQNYQILRNWIVSDACGNSSTQQQVITVRDTLAPQLIETAQNLTLSCIPDNELELAFQDWIGEQAGALALDNCGAISWFAAVPGTYDLQDPATFPGTPSGELDAPDCLTPLPGIYRRETVDFVVYDECFNAVVTTATFTVVDNTPPELEACPTDLSLNTSASSCDTLFVLPLATFSDNCNAELIQVGPPMAGLFISENITSSVPGDFQTPVDPVTLTFGPVPGLPTYASGPATLTIDLNQVDGEGSSEFFWIYGEDGSLLGQTLPTDSQCGNSSSSISVPAALINAWGTDAFITISLEPNIPDGQSGAFAINDLCPAGPPTGGGSSVTGTLTYEAYQPNDLRLQYQINGGDTLDFNISSPPAILLNTGLHQINYFLFDCAGNAAGCSFDITVEDLIAPEINCPEDVTLALTEDLDCANGVPYTLPFPVSVTDNCPFGSGFFQGQPSDTLESLLTFSYDPNYLDFIADDKSFTFSGVSADAGGNGVQLKVITLGDVDNTGEFFRIWGEDNLLLGTNEVGQPNVNVTPGFCSPMVEPSVNEAVFFIPTQLFNNWATDGEISISLESNKSFTQPPPGIFGDGISPFCTFFPSDTLDGTPDGLSRVFLELSYEQTEITYFSTGATDISPTLFPTDLPPVHTFSQGITTVFYTLIDHSGNADTCSFDILVLDTLPPTALCQPITIFVNPSGVDDYILSPEEIDAGSLDNCGIADMQLSQEVISCEQAGTTLSITLTVIDDSGNNGACNALVNVKTLAPQPSFTGGFCENDTLRLFAYPPATSAPNDDFYTYSWTGPPSGLVFSNDENPVITPVNPDDSGPYSVTISGVTGCSATATVNVLIEPQPPAPVLSVDPYFCLGEEAVLSAQAYNGGSIWYFWYKKEGADLILLDSTNAASLTLPPFLETGIHEFLTEVKIDGCPSPLSAPVAVEVFEVPFATLANAPVIEECQGADIELAAANIDLQLTYSWIGPDGFQFSGPNPPVLENVDTFNSGTYLLVVSNAACSSDPVETILLIKPRPNMPAIFGQQEICEEEAFVLFATPPEADSYTWISPFMNTSITSVPELEVPAADSSHDGSWTVFSMLDGCPSEAATGYPVNVAPLPEVEASYSQPACENNPLELASNFFPDADYEWTGPQGYQGFTQTPNAPPVSGTYQVTVTTSAGCTGSDSLDILISEAPVITAISNTGNGCVDGSQDLQLLATLFPPDDGNYTYSWTGPAGYSSSDPAGIIPNATESDNGPYNLTVTNGAGCTSEVETTTVDVVDTPPPPELTPSGQQVFCAGEAVTLSALGDYSGQVTYIWSTPLGTLSGANTSFTIDELAPVNSGEYSVEVIENGCTSAPSNLALLTVNPQPETPALQAFPNPVCQGDTLQLQTKFFANASYQWIGPAGFDATSHNPVIYPVEGIHEGNYAVQVIINGCASEFSPFAFVDVNPRPQAPKLGSNSPLCLSDPGAEILLFVTNGQAGNPLSYSWFELPDEELIAGPSASDSLLLSDLSSYQPGNQSFFAIATNTAGCTSLPSQPVSVEFNEPLAIQAFAGDDQFLCEAPSTQLNADNPAPATGQWTQFAGPPVSISNPANPGSAVSGLQSDQFYGFRWSLSNGACKNFTADTVYVQVDNNNQQAQTTTDLSLCDSSEVLLEAVPAEGNNFGEWSQPLQQANDGIGITDPESNITFATGLFPGEFTFSWTLSNEGCGDFSSAELTVTVGSSTAEEAVAGADRTVCGTDQVSLAAQPPQFNLGMWSSLLPGPEIISPKQAETLVMGLQSGENLFIWQIQNQACGIIASDTVRITYDPGPLALPDTASTSFGMPIEVFPLLNDSLPFSSITTAVLEQTGNGTVEMSGDGVFLYSPNVPFTGEDSFIYEVCSEQCPDLCSEAEVRIRILEEGECIIPTIFTPNGDGINDAFIIPCLEGGRYPSSLLSIFNEWGDEVFRASPYQNDWEGTFNGNPLPVGTYFFVVEFGGDRPPQSGFLILER